jgi:hypothetical protein
VRRVDNQLNFYWLATAANGWNWLCLCRRLSDSLSFFLFFLTHTLSPSLPIFRREGSKLTFVLVQNMKVLQTFNSCRRLLSCVHGFVLLKLLWLSSVKSSLRYIKREIEIKIEIERDRGRVGGERAIGKEREDKDKETQISRTSESNDCNEAKNLQKRVFLQIGHRSTNIWENRFFLNASYTYVRLSCIWPLCYYYSPRGSIYIYSLSKSSQDFWDTLYL